MKPLKVKCLLTTDGQGRKAKAEALREIVARFKKQCCECVEPPIDQGPLQDRIDRLTNAIAEILEKYRHLNHLGGLNTHFLNDIMKLRELINWGDPVHQEDGKWWFWDETWADKSGPFDSWSEANKKLEEYCKHL